MNRDEKLKECFHLLEVQDEAEIEFKKVDAEYNQTIKDYAAEEQELKNNWSLEKAFRNAEHGSKFSEIECRRTVARNTLDRAKRDYQRCQKELEAGNEF